MKLVAMNGDFRVIGKFKRGGVNLSMFILYWVCIFSVNASPIALPPENDGGSGLLKYLPKEFVENLYRLNENEKQSNSQTNLDNFIIMHSHNYANNPLGKYSEAQRAADFGGSLIYDNVPNGPTIVEFDGARRAKNYYAKGSRGFENGADFGINMSPQLPDEFYASYRLYFEPGFDPYVSVKLPGFRMMPPIKTGSGLFVDPTKGAHVYLQIDQQFRMNWNVYHHQMKSTNGERMGEPLNFHTIRAGYWMEVTMRIVLNTPGVPNGILQIWIDGELKNTTKGVLLRTKLSPQKFDQFAVITFMDSEIAVRRNQSMYMDDFFIWTYDQDYLKSNTNVARGLNPHSNEHKLLTPFSANTTEPAGFKIDISANPPEGGKVFIKPSGNE